MTGLHRKVLTKVAPFEGPLFEGHVFESLLTDAYLPNRLTDRKSVQHLIHTHDLSPLD